MAPMFPPSFECALQNLTTDDIHRKRDTTRAIKNQERRKSYKFCPSTSITMGQEDDFAELAEHGVPFWAMQNEDSLKIFKLSVALNKKVHERVAKMKQVSGLALSVFPSL